MVHIASGHVGDEHHHDVTSFITSSILTISAWTRFDLMHEDMRRELDLDLRSFHAAHQRSIEVLDDEGGSSLALASFSVMLLVHESIYD
jgi:hypothetical protein